MQLKRHQPCFFSRVASFFFLFLVFEFLLYQSCWPKYTRRSLLWHRFLLVQPAGNLKQFYYLKPLCWLKITPTSKRHIWRWHSFLLFVPHLLNLSKKAHSLDFELVVGCISLNQALSPEKRSVQWNSCPSGNHKSVLCVCESVSFS